VVDGYKEKDMVVRSPTLPGEEQVLLLEGSSRNKSPADIVFSLQGLPPGCMCWLLGECEYAETRPSKSCDIYSLLPHIER
jgi:hypothetical protein